jgi:hypothetical protein
MSGADLPGILTAGTAVVALLLGARQWNIGRKDSQRQQTAATRLEARQLEADEQQRLIENLRVEVDRAEVARRTEIDRARQEVDRARAEFDKVMALWRATQAEVVEKETAMRLAEHQAQERERRLLSDLHALRLIVQDEIAKTAAEMAYPPET